LNDAHWRTYYEKAGAVADPDIDKFHHKKIVPRQFRMNQPTPESPQAPAKVCTKCRVAKSPTEFHHFGIGGLRIGKWCESCYQKHGTGKAERGDEVK
jgi:hypothetical protein